MASGVEELLDMLFEMVDEAKNMPLSSDKCVLERDRALDLIDDIRAQFPVELGEAKKLVASRNDYIAAAKREAEVIRRRYGLTGELPQTQRQVAAAFSISRSYVSRIEKRALSKLEAALRDDK